MIKDLTVTQLQFLDAVLKRAWKETTYKESAPQLLIKKDNIIMSGDLFLYEDGNPVMQEIDPLGAVDTVKIKISDLTNIVYCLIADQQGKVSAQTAQQFFSSAFIATTILLSEKLLAKTPTSFEEPVPPFLYKPIIYNASFPKLQFYLLDEKEKYAVLSIIFKHQQN